MTVLLCGGPGLEGGFHFICEGEDTQNANGSTDIGPHF